MSNPMRAWWMAGALVSSGVVVLAGCRSEGPGAPPAEAREEAAPAKTAELRKMTPSADYPLKTCVVSGESLGEMGPPLAFEYDGTEVQFCCPGCIKDFKADPAKYLERVRAARKP